MYIMYISASANINDKIPDFFADLFVILMVSLMLLTAFMIAITCPIRQNNLNRRNNRDIIERYVRA